MPRNVFFDTSLGIFRDSFTNHLRDVVESFILLKHPFTAILYIYYIFDLFSIRKNKFFYENSLFH